MTSDPHPEIAAAADHLVTTAAAHFRTNDPYEPDETECTYVTDRDSESGVAVRWRVHILRSPVPTEETTQVLVRDIQPGMVITTKTLEARVPRDKGGRRFSTPRESKRREPNKRPGPRNVSIAVLHHPQPFEAASDDRQQKTLDKGYNPNEIYYIVGWRVTIKNGVIHRVRAKTKKNEEAPAPAFYDQLRDTLVTVHSIWTPGDTPSSAPKREYNPDQPSAPI